MNTRKVKGVMSPKRFFNEAFEFHKSWMLKVKKPAIFMFIHLYKVERKRIDVLAVQGDGKHSPLDVAQTLIERFDPDYYIVLGEGWATVEENIKRPDFKNKEEAWKYINSKYQYGDIHKLPREQRFELLTAIGKTKDGKHKFQEASKIKRNDKEEIIGFEDGQYDKGTLHTEKLP